MDAIPSRRDFLRATLTCAGAVWADPATRLAAHMGAQPCGTAPLGELLGTIPLHGERPRPTTYGELVGGSGLDARQFTDLSRLQPDRLVTPTAEMFIRTAAPSSLAKPPADWSIAAPAFAGGDSAAITLSSLVRAARPMGTHLIECSGNSDPDHFGLMSVVDWEGVPLADIVARLASRPGAAAVLVSGLDEETTRSRTSLAGASWVFPLPALDSLGAFLAVRMNGAPLTPHHGAPVRLVVPGWYGCAWIKWLREIRLVEATQPTTSQMAEFSMRTHQGSVPALALDYTPPVIDLAAMPVRVEKRRVEGRLEYRVVGIVWGGDRPVDRLRIRFRPGDPPTPFVLCPAPASARTWSLWDYRWRPTETGMYTIALTSADPSIRTRRLDVSFYARRVIIDEV